MEQGAIMQMQASAVSLKLRIKKTLQIEPSTRGGWSEWSEKDWKGKGERESHVTTYTVAVTTWKTA